MFQNVLFSSVCTYLSLEMQITGIVTLRTHRKLVYPRTLAHCFVLKSLVLPECSGNFRDDTVLMRPYSVMANTRMHTHAVTSSNIMSVQEV